jgi:hypothetical protein
MNFVPHQTLLGLSNEEERNEQMRKQCFQDFGTEN